MSIGSDRRGFFSEFLREAAGVVREVNEVIRTELGPEVTGEDELWYMSPPLRAHPTQRALSPDDLPSLCDEVGLANRFAQVRELARTSIRLTRWEPESEVPGRSRLGGAPDLPLGFEWPAWNGKELAFLGQLDLAEVAALEAAPLPDRGLLLFFYDVATRPSGLESSHRGSCRVVHVDEDPGHLEPASMGEVLSAYPLDLSLELMLPRSWSPRVEALDLEPDEMAAWDELREKLASAQGVELEELTPHWQSLHRLLGYPEELGSGTELDCQLASAGISVELAQGYLDARRDELEAAAADWRLLLQVSDDKELGVSWGEGFGRLSLWIREQDLQEPAFDGVWAILR